jgi:5-methylcytosine-specific restriction endonuclease McrA
MSVQAIAAVFQLDLSPLSKWILVCLADNADPYGGNIFPTITTLSQKSSIPERTLQRHLKTLVESRVLEVVKLARRPTQNTPGRGTEYRLSFMTNPIASAPQPNYKSCPAKLRLEVIEAFSKTCAYCGRIGDNTGPDGRAWEIDRIVPGSRGGSYSPENVALSCGSCNGSKGAKVAPVQTPALGAKRIEMGANEFDTGANHVDMGAKPKGMGATAMSPNPLVDPSEEPLEDPSIEPSEARAPVKKKIQQLSEEEFLARLESDPAFTGIDVRRLNSKMILWCEVNGKRPTRRRLVNWLNREDKPVQNGNGNGTSQPGNYQTASERRNAATVRNRERAAELRSLGDGPIESILRR